MSGPTCAQPGRWRAAASALLDGESPTISRAQVDAHLAACAACAEWVAQAERMTPELRREALRPPDLTHLLINAAEAHICGCHTGGPCECSDCQCPTCNCDAAPAPAG